MFKLDFDIPESPAKIGLSETICLIGSCFSDEIGSYLRNNKFKTLSNPFGTIYNPHSIFKLLSDQVKPDNTVQSQEVFYHWDTHGHVSGLSEEETKTLFSKKREYFQSFLSTTNWLVITLGTAFVYEHETAGIVANCHKVPATQFKKKLLNQTEIISEFDDLHAHLQNVNPNIKVILTVSPIRHIRDGLIENNRSKAILLDAVRQLQEQYANVRYFPSYEILIDELRDYRFFEKDMTHPSSMAVEYIWQKFGKVYFDDKTRQILTEWTKLRAALKHKPFQPLSSSHQTFLEKTLQKLVEIGEEIDVDKEIESVKAQIKKG